MRGSRDADRCRLLGDLGPENTRGSHPLRMPGLTWTLTNQNMCVEGGTAVLRTPGGAWVLPRRSSLRLVVRLRLRTLRLQLRRAIPSLSAEEYGRTARPLAAVVRRPLWLLPDSAVVGTRRRQP